MAHHPQLVALSAPSGAGKSTICKLLLDRNPDFRLSISATTRAPRNSEQQEVDYYFLSSEDFRAKATGGAFLEYEKVHGNYYGTLKAKVEALLKAGFTVLFDIDVNGALRIKEHYPERALLIFIRPPSLEELKRRLRDRNTDDPAEIEKRLRRLPEEYAKAERFDVNIVNEDLQSTTEQIEELIRQYQTER